MKEKILGTIIAIFIIQFGILFIIRELDKKQESHQIEKLRLEKLFGVELDENMQPKSTTLHLCCKGWSEIPLELLTFNKVETLHLNSNKFDKFPYELLKMPNLKTINLNNNQIKKLDFNQKNTTLLNLSLSNNQIKTITNIEILEVLEMILLDSNRISELPNLKQSKLTKVFLNKNQVEQLTDNFSKHLEYLNLSENKLKTIDTNIDFESKRLQQLDLSDNKNLETIPNNFLAMSNLRTLNLNNCNLKNWSVKEGLVNKNLKKLELEFNQLTSFETDSKQLPNLSRLHLTNNQLRLVKIKHQKILTLDLSANQLKVEGLRLNLPFAKVINLYNNELKSFPSDCLIAPNLEKLDLNQNYITTEQGKDIWLRFPKILY